MEEPLQPFPIQIPVLSQKAVDAESILIETPLPAQFSILWQPIVAATSFYVVSLRLMNWFFIRMTVEIPHPSILAMLLTE